MRLERKALITDIDYTVTIFRTEDGQLQQLVADKLTQLRPGDSLEISVQEITEDAPLTE